MLGKLSSLAEIVEALRENKVYKLSPLGPGDY